MIKHIIIDFGGVIYDLGGLYTVFPDHLAIIFGISYDDAVQLWAEQKEPLITGKETSREFLQRISEQLHILINIEVAYAAWKESYKLEEERINWRLLTYLKELKKNYGIHLLSDTIDLDDEKSLLWQKIVPSFDSVFKSYKIKRRKPFKETFLYVADQICAKPEVCVFVDDYAPNVKAAESVGMYGIVYENVSQFSASLELLKRSISKVSHEH